MANASEFPPPSPPQPFNRELFRSKLLPKDKKSQVVFAKTVQPLDSTLEQKKITSCIEAIQGQDRKSLQHLLKTTRGISFAPLYKAVEALQNTPDFATHYLWSRSIMLVFAIKYGDKSTFFSVLNELANEKRDLHQAIKEAHEQLKEKDSADKATQQAFTEDMLALFQIGSDIHKRQNETISSLFTQGQALRLYEAIELHPELGHQDVTYLQEIELDLVKKAIATADMPALEPFLKGSNSPQILLQEAMRRLEKEDPTNKQLAFMKKVIASIDTLFIFVKEKERPSAALPLLQLFKISHFALSKLEQDHARNDSTVFHKAETSLERSLQIDFEKRRFSILSKKASLFKAEGTSKRVTGAPGYHLPTPMKTVRLVNRRGKEFHAKELSYLKKYNGQHIHSIAKYTSIKPGKAPQEKISLIMDGFDSDLCRFCGYGKVQASQKLAPKSIASICQAIATTVQKMHLEGDIHRDLKQKNILYRFTADTNEEEVLVSDFGHTYAAKTETPAKKCYGTANFTSPERLKQQVTLDTPQERLEQGIKDDMFAMGCLLFELLHQKPIPWGKDVRQYYKKAEEKDKVTALEKYEQAMHSLVKELAETQDIKTKQLLDCCLQLLQPDPQKRWATEPLLQALK